MGQFVLADGGALRNAATPARRVGDPAATRRRAAAGAEDERSEPRSRPDGRDRSGCPGAGDERRAEGLFAGREAPLRPDLVVVLPRSAEADHRRHQEAEAEAEARGAAQS